jgi:hypothetical protein
VQALDNSRAAAVETGDLRTLRLHLFLCKAPRCPCPCRLSNPDPDPDTLDPDPDPDPYTYTDTDTDTDTDAGPYLTLLCKAAASRDAAQLRTIPAQLTELIVSPPAGAATADGAAADATAWRGACASGFALLMAPMPRLLVRGRGARLLSLQQQRTLEARLTKTAARARARPRTPTPTLALALALTVVAHILSRRASRHCSPHRPRRRLRAPRAARCSPRWRLAWCTRRRRCCERKPPAPCRYSCSGCSSPQPRSTPLRRRPPRNRPPRNRPPHRRPLRRPRPRSTAAPCSSWSISWRCAAYPSP